MQKGDKYKGRVLLFSTGWHEYMISLANAMSKYAEVILVLPENHKLTPAHTALIDPKVIFEPFHVVFHKSIRDNFRMLLGIYRIFKKYKPDIIHIQANGHNNFHYLVPFLFFRRKIINTIHDPEYHLGDKVSLAQRRRFTKVWSRLYTNHYIVHGDFLVSELSKSYKVSEEKISPVPHGHLGIYKHFQKKGDVKENPKMVLFFGRIWKYKGLEYFIKAANLVIDKIPDALFCIAGQGDDISIYDKFFTKGKKHFIIKNYRIPMEEAGSIYQSSAVVVLPYLEATQSGVIPVAFAYRKPVIASRTGAIPEVVEDGVTGFLTEPANEKQIAEKIITLLKDEDLRIRMGKAAEEKTRNDLSWDSIAMKTLEIYQK